MYFLYNISSLGICSSGHIYFEVIIFLAYFRLEVISNKLFASINSNLCSVTWLEPTVTSTNKIISRVMGDVPGQGVVRYREGGRGTTDVRIQGGRM